MVNYSDKLSELLFLEIKSDVIYNMFGHKIDDNVNFPVRSKRLINDIKNSEGFNGFPVSYIIEGIVFLLGADPCFKYNNIYKAIINNNANNILIIKKIIAEEVKANLIEDSFILLKGLAVIEPNADNYEKLILIARDLALNDKEYINEEKKIIEDAKMIKNFPLVYFYEAILKYEEEDFEYALVLMDKYNKSGGAVNKEIQEFVDRLNISANYDKGSKLSTTEPLEALKKLLPLLEKLEDNPSIYYHIAVAYRNLKDFQKAIYYLNEAIRLDNNIVEVYNEFGLNYASLGEYENAIRYFRKAFEATKSIEICTNLVLCYYNKGDIDQAKLHFEIAKKINSDDEIVRQLETIICKN